MLIFPSFGIIWILDMKLRNMETFTTMYDKLYQTLSKTNVAQRP